MVGGIDYTHNAICLQDIKSSTYLLRQLARADTTTMKFTAFLFAAIAVLGVVTGTDQPAVKTPAEALEKIQASTLPDGVTLTGMSEKIDPPASATAVAVKESEVNDGKNEEDDKKKEQFGWGLGGLGGWGSWGGWGGYGPYRFGFMYGGLPGWAYPLGYWNRFGAGLYGGGCGLGLPFGGLYYC